MPGGSVPAPFVIQPRAHTSSPRELESRPSEGLRSAGPPGGSGPCRPLLGQSRPCWSFNITFKLVWLLGGEKLWKVQWPLAGCSLLAVQGGSINVLEVPHIRMSFEFPAPVEVLFPLPVIRKLELQRFHWFLTLCTGRMPLFEKVEGQLWAFSRKKRAVCVYARERERSQRQNYRCAQFNAVDGPSALDPRI